jgi:2-dehydro-3-deoxyphosphogluconate aldolase/(4S)-4-hydroxy-2-oxoglutarate aldolase
MLGLILPWHRDAILQVIVEAKNHGLSFAPGVATPSDIEIAIEQGCRILKYFPAETAGGLKYLSSMAAPYQHLDLKFIPLGGINIGNAADYLDLPSLLRRLGVHG